MRYLLCLICFFFILEAPCQSLRDINYNYQYNPEEPFTFELKSTKQDAGFILFYKLQVPDTASRADEFLIEWQIRENLSDQEGVPLTVENRRTSGNKTSFSGAIYFTSGPFPPIIVAKVVNPTLKRAWFFYEILNPIAEGYLTMGGEVLLKPFLDINDTANIHGFDRGVISMYEDDFPTALPPFSESMGPVSKGILVDSTLQLNRENDINFSKKGLYLVQKDTSSLTGLAFRSEKDYPRLATIQSIAGPLIYICSKQEHDRIQQAKNDKKAFDKVILSITNDTERARKLMRSYFRRVELANIYFTSYKEGWKTDRGMIYIIFGLPDEIFKFSDREVWNYKTNPAKASFKATFNFTKSGSIFDPDNYVLIRDKKYRETWYEVIDLWRNARF